jgi:hypothetical protein
MAEPRVQTLTIPNAGTTSNVVYLKDQGAWRSFNAMLYAPATLPETVTVEVSPDDVVWDTLRASGSDITLAAGKADPLIGLTCYALRLKAGAAVAGARVFTFHALAVN